MSHSSHFNKGNICIFIDGNNLFNIAQQMNIEIDYIKLLKNVTNNQKVLKTYFYGIIDSNNDKQQGFYTWLKHNGYKVFTRSHMFDSNNKKPNLDVDIAVDLIRYSSKFDTAILIAGSPDLSSAVHHVLNIGCRVEYIGLKNILSSPLGELCDKVTDIYDIKASIEKHIVPIHEKYNAILANSKKEKEV